MYFYSYTKRSTQATGYIYELWARVTVDAVLIFVSIIACSVGDDQGRHNYRIARNFSGHIRTDFNVKFQHKAEIFTACNFETMLSHAKPPFFQLNISDLLRVSSMP